MEMYILLLVAALTGSTVNNCQVSHSDIKVQYAASVHAHEDLSCTTCHGGDASVQDRKLAHTGDFRSLRDRKQIPAECGSCHSSTEKMKPYGLSTDQVALYET